jgi:hypothetical protein
MIHVDGRELGMVAATRGLRRELGLAAATRELQRVQAFRRDVWPTASRSPRCMRSSLPRPRSSFRRSLFFSRKLSLLSFLAQLSPRSPITGPPAAPPSRISQSIIVGRDKGGVGDLVVRGSAPTGLARCGTRSCGPCFPSSLPVSLSGGIAS